MRQIQPQLLGAAALGMAALASPSQAQQGIVFGSQTTLIGEADPLTGSQTVIGACGGSVQAIAVDTGQVTISTTTGALYRKTVSEPFVQFWQQAENDATALAVVFGSVLAGGSDGTLRLYAYDQPGQSQLIDTLPFPIEALTVHEWQVYAAGPFGTLMVGDPFAGGFQFLPVCAGSITALVGFTQHPERLLYVATGDGSLWTFDLETNSFASFLTLPEPATGLAVFDSDLIVGSASGLARRIDRQTGGVKQIYDAGVSIEALGMAKPAVGGIVASFCEGAACACGNEDDDHSCANSTGWGTGAIVAGTSSVTLDDLSITAFDLPPNTLARFYMGQPMGTFPFGAGVICVGSGGYSTFRFPPVNTGPHGILELGPGIAGFANSSFGVPDLIAPGSFWAFQGWYRDPAGPCGATVNTTEAFAVTFVQ